MQLISHSFGANSSSGNGAVEVRIYIRHYSWEQHDIQFLSSRVIDTMPSSLQKSFMSVSALAFAIDALNKQGMLYMMITEPEQIKRFQLHNKLWE